MRLEGGLTPELGHAWKRRSIHRGREAAGLLGGEDLGVLGEPALVDRARELELADLQLGAERGEGDLARLVPLGDGPLAFDVRVVS